jgi:hypothetical protein
VGPRLRETQRTETWDRVDYPDKESRYSTGGKSGLMMYIAIRATRGAEEAALDVVWGSNIEWEIYVGVLRDSLYRILWS